MKAEILMGAMSVVAFAMAGCIEDGATDALDLDGAAVGQVDTTIFTGSTCTTAGGISVYDGTGNVGPFQEKDMQPFIGDPVVGTYGLPIASRTSGGIWHMTTVCEGYTVDGEDRGGFSMGWIAEMIEKPEWDTSGIERQYVVADLSMTDLSLVDVIREGTGVEISTMYSGTIEWMGPNAFTSIVDEANHGVFRTDAVVQEFATHETETIRFWMLVAVTADAMHGHEEEEGVAPGVPGIPAEQGASDAPIMYRPISFDLVTEMTTDGAKLAGPGFLSHTDNENHGNSVGAAGNIQGLIETGDFTATLKLGPSPALLLDSTWTH